MRAVSTSERDAGPSDDVTLAFGIDDARHGDRASRCHARNVFRGNVSVRMRVTFQRHAASVRARMARARAWTYDGSRSIARAPCGRSIRYVSRADVKFLYDEIVQKKCYGERKDGNASRARDRVDVGGNIGLAAVSMAADVGEGGRVVTLEPMERAYACLRRNAREFCGAPGEGVGGGARVGSVMRAFGDAHVAGGGGGSGCGAIFAYNAGAGATRDDGRVFVEFPRAAGWCTPAEHRDDAETVDNLVKYVFDALATPMDADGERRDGLEENAATRAGRALRSLVLDDDARGGASARVMEATWMRKMISHAAAFFLRLVVRCVAAWMLADARETRRPVVTVSDVIDSHDLQDVFLKVDVERSELDVLRGVTNEHWKRIRCVNVECHASTLEPVSSLLRSKFADVSVERLFGDAQLFVVRASDSTTHEIENIELA